MSARSIPTAQREDAGVSSGCGAEPLSSPYFYAILRVVPQVERGECINAGVVLFSRPQRFLGVRVFLDDTKLHALAPACDAGIVREYLNTIVAVASGEADAGPIAKLELSERFHWIAATSNTIIQPSPVHTGLTNDPAATLDHLFQQLVREG